MYFYTISIAKGRFWMDDVFCDGNETEVSHCRFGGWANNDCEASEAAGVICLIDDEQLKKKTPSTTKAKKRKHRFGLHLEMEVRLSGGRSQREGQVEVNNIVFDVLNETNASSCTLNRFDSTNH